MILRRLPRRAMIRGRTAEATRLTLRLKKTASSENSRAFSSGTNPCLDTTPRTEDPEVLLPPDLPRRSSNNNGELHFHDPRLRQDTISITFLDHLLRYRTCTTPICVKGLRLRRNCFPLYFGYAGSGIWSEPSSSVPRVRVLSWIPRSPAAQLSPSAGL